MTRPSLKLVVIGTRMRIHLIALKIGLLLTILSVQLRLLKINLIQLSQMYKPILIILLLIRVILLTVGIKLLRQLVVVGLLVILLLQPKLFVILLLLLVPVQYHLVNHEDGDLWLNSNTGVLYFYYEDPNSSQWISVSTGPEGPTGPQGPTGSYGSTWFYRSSRS